MERKEAIQYISILLGGTLVGANSFLLGCKAKDEAAGFSSADAGWLDEAGETILPQTTTAGAKAAAVGKFMILMVDDCYAPTEQEIFRKGMQTIDKEATAKFGASFLEIKPAQRHELFVQLDKEQKEYTKAKKENDPVHYFRMLKELTLLGYFTSKQGCTEGKRYMPLPGKYIGCVPYQKGEKAII